MSCKHEMFRYYTFCVLEEDRYNRFGKNFWRHIFECKKCKTTILGNEIDGVIYYTEKGNGNDVPIDFTFDRRGI